MTECEYCAPDRLSVVVRKVRETVSDDDAPVDAHVDAQIAAAVVEALYDELPEHFGPEALSSYQFWLKNRVAALRAGKPFHRWVMTTSYLHYPELLMCE